MLCKNERCMAPLGDTHWGDGYCSRRCMSAADDYDHDADAPLMDPSDPTGHAEICRNRDEVDAMMAAAAIDPRLPKIIYLRRKGATLRKIGSACGLAESAVRKIFDKCAPNLLRACGLRKI